MNKAYKAMYEILKKGRLHNFSIKCQYDLFDKVVKPILLYGCEIWGFTNIDIIERVHLKFCKLLLNLKKSTPNYMTYGELGVFPMSVFIELRMVNFWAKLVNSENHKLTSILYKFMILKNEDEAYNFDWLVCVKNILDKCGFSNIWEIQGNFNPKWLNISIKQRLMDQFRQKWKSDIDNSPKALCYRLFKENLEFEEYLDLLSDKDKITFCRFRTGYHRLPTETSQTAN